jgi:RNA binding exosome subunit
LSNENKTFRLKEITFSCSAHATEVLESVKTAVKHLVPEDLREKVEVESLKMTGHAGNPIHLIELIVSKSKPLKSVLAYLASKLEDYDKEFLYRTLDTRLSKDNLMFFRVNKQDAFNEVLRIESEDNTIRVILKFIVYKSEPNQIKDALVEYGIIKKG